MFAVSVPGSSIPGPEIPDVVVVGSKLDIVDALLGAGVSSIVLACSGDALRHAMRRAREVGTVVILDARGRGEIAPDVIARASDFRQSTVLVWGATDAEDATFTAFAARVLWCCESVSPRAIAKIASSRKFPFPAAA